MTPLASNRSPTGLIRLSRSRRRFGMPTRSSRPTVPRMRATRCSFRCQPACSSHARYSDPAICASIQSVRRHHAVPDVDQRSESSPSDGTSRDHSQKGRSRCCGPSPAVIAIEKELEQAMSPLARNDQAGLKSMMRQSLRTDAISGSARLNGREKAWQSPLREHPRML
jgi:hypothetical protein